MLDTGRWSNAIVTIDAGKIHYFHAHLLRLDAPSRLKRFCHLASDAYLHDYVQGLDLTRSSIIGFFGDGEMHAAAEIRPSGSPRARVFEAAFSVESLWQGRGIGTALLLRAISIARGRGADHIVIDCLAANERMREIAARFDTDLQFAGHDCQAWLPLAEFSRDGSAQASVPASRQ